MTDVEQRQTCKAFGWATMRGWYRRDPGWLSTAMGSWCNAMREEGTLLVLGS